MDDIPRSILIPVFIVLGGCFAGSETAISYCNKMRMKKRADEGDAGARRVVSILDRFDKALSTILTCTNLCYVFASSFAAVLAVRHFGSVGALVSTAIMTVLIFFFAETIPKNIARANSDAYASVCAVPLSVLMAVLTPVTFVFSLFGSIAKRLLPQVEEQPSLTEDEFSTIIDNIEDEGLIKHDESELIKSAIEFSDTRACEIMTPVNEMLAVSINETPEKLRETVLNEKYSRLPVYAGTRDRIVGVLQAHEVLSSILEGKTPEIGSVMMLPYFVDPQSTLLEIFEGLGKRRTHIAVVTDESGNALGIVTMEDILEELVGEIYDEDDDASLNGGEAQ